MGYQTSKCTSFRNVNGAYNGAEPWTYSDHLTVQYRYFSTTFPTKEEWVAYLDENPLDMWYQTTEEQAFYPLPDDEQTLLNNLETYYGVTNMWNNQGCPMWIKYVADTKLYADNQFLEIKQSIV